MGLELAEQVRSGQLPEPETIFVPVGSAGTAAGLLLGLRLAGLSSRLLAVAVTRAPTTWPLTVAALANAGARLLSRPGMPGGAPSLSASDVRVLSKWLRKGYSRPTLKGEQATAMLQETEGLALDPTYTAKTVAALIDLRQRGELGEGPVLYWHTYNAVPLPPAKGTDDLSRLPPPLRRILRRTAAVGQGSEA